ncbi:MAG: MBL fold metallo-hydrolase [bacterium]|nr:MBL fold metallo-hydrolase [bacterium]
MNITATTQRTISTSITLVQDTCHVYIVRSGKEAVLIDFGSGDVLDMLPALGIEQVAAVLMTHHHRDQGQGLRRAVEAGIPVHVPYNEQHLFADVEAHWQGRELLNNYDTRSDRFSLLENVPVAGTLHDYATYDFGGIRFQVIPTPGHTTGSITLLADIDEIRVAFTGDLIAGPGKVWSLAAMQWSYNGGEGLPASVASLVDLKRRAPDLLLPSHGEVVNAPFYAIDLLVSRLRDLMTQRGQNPRLMALIEQPYSALTPHLLWNRTSQAYSYVLLSESGKALIFDYGYDLMTGFSSGHDRSARRPWLYTLEALKRDFGVRAIEAAIPTHYHDDHVAGMNLLREVEGAQVWAAETFAELLEAPTRYDLPCLWYDTIAVDRRLPLETPIQWEEYTFTLHPLPGHTLYAVAISLEVDGQRVLITGDQYEHNTRYNYVYKNRFRAGDYVQSADLYARLHPDLILTGHTDPFWPQPEYFEVLRDRGEILATLHQQLLPPEALTFDSEAVFARIHPYQLEAGASSWVTFEVEVDNPYEETLEAAIAFIVPDGWETEPAIQRLMLAGGTTQMVMFRVQVGASTVRRARVAVDLTLNEQRFGQQAEALVTVTQGDVEVSQSVSSNIRIQQG